MLFHRLNKDTLSDFVKHPYMIVLILSGIASINSNIPLFGGPDSISFKIKAKKVNQYLKKIFTI